LSKLVKESFLYSIGNSFPALGGFIFLPIYLKFMSVEEYGIVSSMIVIQSIASIFFSLAIERSVMRLYFDHSSKIAKGIFFGSNFISIFVISTFFVIIFLFSKDLLKNIFSDINFYPYYFYALLIAYVKCFLFVPKIYLQVNHKVSQYVLLSFGQFVFVNFLVLYFVVYLKEGAFGMLKGQLIGITFLIPFLFSIVRKNFILNFDFSILKKSLDFSLPIIPTLLTVFVLNLSDRVFIDKYLGLAEVGLYSLAYKVAMISLLAISSVNLAVTPHFFKKLNEKGFFSSQKWSLSFNNNLIKTIGLIVLIVLMFSNEIVLILFGYDYFESISVVGLLLISYYFAGTNSVNGRLIQFQKKTHHSMIIDIFCALLNVGLNFLLIPDYGLIGAALATLISMLMAFIISFIYVKFYLGFLPVSLKIHLSIFLGLVVMYTINSFSSENLVLFFTIKIILLMVIGFKKFDQLKFFLKQQ
jgi:O-antigen/teichoic acid export membrane protein